jgi:hypothetical protein
MPSLSGRLGIAGAGRPFQEESSRQDFAVFQKPLQSIDRIRIELDHGRRFGCVGLRRRTLFLLLNPFKPNHLAI